jgi:hypothetical protein
MDAEKLRRLFDLSGRTAIITGGTRGIGLALARGGCRTERPRCIQTEAFT